MGDLDRRKHDVDVIERVLGGVQETSGAPDASTRRISLDLPCEGGGSRPTLELTVGLASDDARSRSSRHRRDDR